MDFELTVIRIDEQEYRKSYSFRSDFKELVFVVEFSKKPVPVLGQNGISNSWSLSVFHGKENGRIEDYVPLMTDSVNDPDKDMANYFAKKMVEKIASDRK